MSPVPSMWWTAGCRCDPRAFLAYLEPYAEFGYVRQKYRRSVAPPDTQEVMMTFREILAQVVTWLQQDKRVSYRALKRQFALDDAALADLQDAILYAYPQVSNDAGRGLVWTPAAPAVAAEAAGRFDAVLAAVTALLRCEGRVTYRLLRLACGLDETLLEAVCRELTFKQVAHDAHGEGLVWTGEPYAILPPASPTVRQPTLPDTAELSASE